ncbi:MAG: tetratricopeptide repeat protein [Syntrophobacterales bacterium]|nr:tetratricopeptide repeat protein [Syntrophobacterales bacterium]
MRAARYLVLLILAGAVWGCAAQAPVKTDAQAPETAQELYSRGNEDLARGQNEKALKEYTRALELDPKLSEAYTDRGIAYKRLNRFDLAMADFNRAIELDPKDADAYANRGLIHNTQRRYDLAQEDFDRAIQLDPQLAMAYWGRGSALIGKGSRGQAIQDFNKAIALNPNTFEFFLSRGMAYLTGGETDLALADFNRGVKVNPRRIEGYFLLGVIYFDRGQYQQAIAVLSRGINPGPKMEREELQALLFRAQAYEKTGERQKALADYQAVLKAATPSQEKESRYATWRVRELEGGSSGKPSGLKPEPMPEPFKVDSIFRIKGKKTTPAKTGE